MVRFFQKQLSYSFARDDCKELVELCLLIIFKELLPQSFKMHYPGAFYKAQWMGKLIYSMKIIRLSIEIEEQFPKG